MSCSESLDEFTALSLAFFSVLVVVLNLRLFVYTKLLPAQLR